MLKEEILKQMEELEKDKQQVIENDKQAIKEIAKEQRKLKKVLRLLEKE